MATASNYTIQVVVDALHVLETIAGNNGRINLGELSQATRMPKSKVFRIVHTLEGRDYIQRVPGAGTFALGSRLADLSALANGRYDLAPAARPHMRRLWEKYDETVNLAIPDGVNVVTLEGLESSQRIRLIASTGIREPIHATSLGKAMLAFMPPAELEALLRQIEFVPVGPNTITGADSLRAELDKVRARGYAIDDEEFQAGARCVGAPILGADGRPLGALSISGPTHRLTLAQLLAMGEDVHASALACSLLLGYGAHANPKTGGLEAGND